MFAGQYIESVLKKPCRGTHLIGACRGVVEHLHLLAAGGDSVGVATPVNFGGNIERYHDNDGHLRRRWVPGSVIYGVAYDTPILGYGVLNVNLLRLWKSEARESFDLQAFNTGDYYGAVDDMVVAGLAPDSVLRQRLPKLS